MAICRYCKLSEPTVIIPLKAGKSRGECISCRRQKEQHRRNKAALFKGLHNKANALVNFNLTILRDLDSKPYPLTHRLSNKPAGYIVIKPEHFYVMVWNEAYLLRPSIAGLATWLADMNIGIDTAPMILTTPEGAVVQLEDIGKGLPLQDIADKLVMFDIALQEYAYKRLKRELDQAKKSVKGISAKR